MASEELSLVRLVDRRRFLGGAAVAAAAAIAWRPSLSSAQSGLLTGGGYPFTLGVASGDPLPTAVVLWTRLAPDPLNGGGMPNSDVPVDWVIATDEGLANVVASGTATAPAAFAHSVHVDATGLDPDTTYWYQFRADGLDSPVGRTRTAPPPGSSPASVRFGFASCQNYGSGYFTAHANLANEDLDVCFHLGDYIYEGAGGGVRSVPGGEATTLAGYRNRYALYRSDPDLQAVHRRFPWVVTWDDHEVENNYAADISEEGITGVAFLTRRAEAYQAWWEHQAVRMPPPVSADLPIYRNLTWGTLASFFVLDTRQYRSDQACGGATLAPLCAEALDPARTMLGAAQEQWIANGLTSSAALWNVVAQQVVMAYTPLVGQFNLDQWDGYPAARDRLLELFGRPEVRNPLVLTGDIHASGAGRLLADYDNPDTSAVVGHELVGTSVTSTFPGGLDDLFNQVTSGLPWVEYANASKRGYVTVELTADSGTANWRVVDTVTATTSAVQTDFTWDIPLGDSGGAVDNSGTPVVTAAPRFTG